MNEANKIEIIMDAASVNEAFARAATAAFLMPLDPTVGEISDIKTAVSEAVTNAIIHGCEGGGKVRLTLRREGREVFAEVSDDGAGIADIKSAREPMYTTKPELERSGLGFTVMESFMDAVTVRSEEGRGTLVTMSKRLSGE